VKIQNAQNALIYTPLERAANLEQKIRKLNTLQINRQKTTRAQSPYDVTDTQLQKNMKS